MKSPGSNIINLSAAMLSIPATYVIMISLLKYGLGVEGPFHVSAPVLESWGIKDALGWNISLLLPFGPLIAPGLMLFQVLQINMNSSEQERNLQFSIRRKWIPLAISGWSITIMAILCIYSLGEN